MRHCLLGTLLASVGIGMDAVHTWAAGERFVWRPLGRGRRMIHSWVSGGVGARRWWWWQTERNAKRMVSHVTCHTCDSSPPSPSTTPEPSNEVPRASYSPTALQQSPKQPTAMIQVRTAPTPALLRRSQSPAHPKQATATNKAPSCSHCCPGAYHVYYMPSEANKDFRTPNSPPCVIQRALKPPNTTHQASCTLKPRTPTPTLLCTPPIRPSVINCTLHIG